MGLVLTIINFLCIKQCSSIVVVFAKFCTINVIWEISIASTLLCYDRNRGKSNQYQKKHYVIDCEIPIGRAEHKTVHLLLQGHKFLRYFVQKEAFIKKDNHRQ